MNQHAKNLFVSRLRRLLSGLLCAVMLCGLLPTGLSLAGSAGAAEVRLPWSNEDLETLREYRIMRGDEGGMRPNSTITRAEFAAMVNRTLGYKEKAAKFNFKDVKTSDWFYDDLSISNNMGYLKGTSPTAMSPNDTLTREEALVILSRNMMLVPAVGESLNYADSRSFGSWSRGYIDPAIEAGLIDADRTGSFNPQKPITRGEVAGMLVRAVGIPIQNAGLTSLGTVNGNVTITTSNVTLRNTTINGDLYLTGGIGLGDVLLDNVRVNGKIVDSGAGLSEKGEISVTLNNVTADELIVDSMRNQTISLAAKGYTSIPKTSLRTSAYVDDSTPANYGLDLIEIDGEEKTAVRLSGNIKEVFNKTRNSSLTIGEGVAKKVTVDEAATGSTVDVSKDARIEELNLDAGVKVSGSGYVDKVTINANGATVAQLPDEIIIAPGITATVNKVKMDTAAAQEASSRPKLMPGYPYPDDLTPNSTTAIFKTNKPGTVYWALTAQADGSPDEEDIISPPSYSKKIIKSGSVKTKESNKEYTVKITGLSSDASYYLSAIVLDDRGSRSTMKVAAFTTPDNSTPAFSKGYPVMSQISEKDAQVSVMTTKSCQLYYAVLPKGGTAPRAIDFKTGSISGNLGYGSVKMAKDSPAYIFVNDVDLEEKQDYVLYLWLNDFDSAKSSAVKSLNFTTQDRTDPIVSNVRQTKSTTTSVTAAYTMNEAGNFYWAVFRAGDETFKTPAPGYTTSNWLSSKVAMERLVAGTGAIKSGKSAVSAAKAGTDISFTVSSLNSKTTGTSSYDLYYVGVDAAGNFSKPIKYVTVYTEDKTDPTVAQKFTSYNEDDPKKEDTLTPLADTNIRLVFSKQVGATDVNGDGSFYSFLELYRGDKSAKEKLVELLRNNIKFYIGTGTKTLAPVWEKNTDTGKDTDTDWVIDYRKATVYVDGTDMVVEFPNDTLNPKNSALNLANGETYQFVVSPQKGNIRDTTANRNEMARTPLPAFTTKRAQITLKPAQGVTVIDFKGEKLEADFTFQLDPKSTTTSPDGIFYDIMIWSSVSVSFDLYKRDNANGTWGPWTRVNETPYVGPDNQRRGAFSYNIDPEAGDGKEVYMEYETVASVIRNTEKAMALDYSGNALTTLKEGVLYQYAAHFVTYGSSDAREKWSISNAKFRVTIPSGNTQDLATLAQSFYRNNDTWTGTVSSTENSIESIGVLDPYNLAVSISSTAPPELSGSAPTFNMLDTSGKMSIQLDLSPSIIYWIVSKLNTDDNGNPISDGNVQVQRVDGKTTFTDIPHAVVPWNGSAAQSDASGKRVEVLLTNPDSTNLIDERPKSDYPELLQSGVERFTSAGISTPIKLNDLDPDSWYGVYMMFRSNSTSPRAVAYTFKTQPAITPVLRLTTEGLDPSSSSAYDPKTKTYTLSVIAQVEKTNGDVTAWLLPITQISGTILEKGFNEASGLSTTYTKPGSEKFTVLDALTTRVSTTNQISIFDYETQKTITDETVKAKVDALRRDVQNLITNTSGGKKWGTNMIPVDTDKTPPISERTLMQFSVTDVDVTYVCIAMAQNTSDDTKVSFYALDDVQLMDTEGPTAEKADEALNFDFDDDGKLILEGSIYVTYTNDLYLRDQNGVTHQFTTVKKTTSNQSKFGDWWTPDNVSGYGPSRNYEIVTDTGDEPLPTRLIEIMVHRTIGGTSIPTTWTTTILLPDFCNRNGYKAANQSVEITYRNGSFTAKIIQGS